MKFKPAADKLYSRLEKKEDEYYKPRKVYPVLDEEGNIQWFNLLTGGTWWKLLGILAFIIIALGFIVEYHNNFQECAQVLSNYNLNLTQQRLADGSSVLNIRLLNVTEEVNKTQWVQS